MTDVSPHVMTEDSLQVIADDLLQVMTEVSPQFMAEDSPQVMTDGTVDDDIGTKVPIPGGNQTPELQVQTEWQQEELCVSG
jgi:hypothetical protein